MDLSVHNYSLVFHVHVGVSTVVCLIVSRIPKVRLKPWPWPSYKMISLA